MRDDPGFARTGLKAVKEIFAVTLEDVAQFLLETLPPARGFSQL
jgi:hypothetical protein